MAKKTAPQSEVAFKFIYDAKKLKELLDTNPNKVVFTIRIEEETTKDDRKVGALKISAAGTYAKTKNKLLMASASMTIDGCPKPPCTDI